MALDIEYCGSGWQSVLDGSATCESGHCCSIHGKCGLEEYHCWFGMSAEWILFVGIMLTSVWGLVYALGANRRITSLMEDYKRRGERIDALVVPTTTTKRTWSECIRHLQEGTRHCRWNRITLEYNVKTINPNSNKEESRRVRKTMSVSGYILSRTSREGTIRVLVLPGQPMSAFARDEVDLTMLKQQKQIRATYFFILLFIALYLFLVLLVVSLVGGKENKKLGWIYFFSNFLWSPPLPYLFGRSRERKEHSIWLTDGEFVNDSDAKALLGQGTA
jgi:hypothetical protein